MSEGYDDDEYSEDESRYQPNDDDSDDIQNLSGFGAGEVSRPGFEEAQFQYAAHMGQSHYLKDLLQSIMKMRVTTEYQLALIRCANTIFNDDILMANNTLRKTGRFGHQDPLYYVRIQAQLCVVLTRIHATQADMQVAASSEIEKQMMMVFEAYNSRTIGPKRERLINGELTSRSVQATEYARYTDEGNRQKKNGGWLGKLGFGGR